MRIIVKLGIIYTVCMGAMSCPDTPDCGSCAPGDPYNYCNSCIDSIMDDDSNFCRPVPKSKLIPHCIDYTQLFDNTICRTCDFGFYRSVDSLECIPFSDPLCAKGYQDSCEYCFDQHVLNKETQKCEAQQKCKTENCSLCNDDLFPAIRSCLICKQGFALFDNYDKNTVSCAQSVDNCLTHSVEDPMICYWCMPNYYITSKGTCERVPHLGELIPAPVGSSAARSLWKTRDRSMQM